MEDMSNDVVQAICRTLVENKVGDVLGLKMKPECSWTTFLIIGTVTSRVHMRGAASAAGKEMRAQGLDVSGSGNRKQDESAWRIINGGHIVVSLMNPDSRAFYALEDRWFEAAVVFGEKPQSSISS